MSRQAPPLCPLTIALLDDHDVVRRGSFAYLSAEPQFLVVGCHARSTDLLDTLASRRVDVAVLDFTLAPDDVTGLELLWMIHNRFPRVRLLLYTAQINPLMMASAFAAGAAGVTMKTESLSMLTIAILQVAEGLRRMPGGLSEPVEDAPLSRSEREVLRLCLAGMSVTEIACRRHRSVKTVSTQKHSAFRKLGLRSDGDLFTLRHQLPAI